MLASADLRLVNLEETSGDGDWRRSAGRLRREKFRGRSSCKRFGDAAIDILCDGRCQPSPRMSPLSGSRGAAAIVIATARAADGALLGFGRRAVALMGCLANAARVRWR